MGWPAIGWTTGVKATDFAAGLSALTIAVNQRRDAIGLARHSFVYNEEQTRTSLDPQPPYYAGARDPSAVRLRGQTMQDIFKDIQDQILALSDALAQEGTDDESNINFLFFVTAENGDVMHTAASLTSVAYGDWPTNPDVWNANDWGRIKAALDKLLYVRVHVGKDNTYRRWSASVSPYMEWVKVSIDRKNGEYDHAGGYAGVAHFEDAWDDMHSNSPVTTSSDYDLGTGGSARECEMRVWSVPAEYTAYAQMAFNGTRSFDLTSLSGVISSQGKLVFTYNIEGTADFGGLLAEQTVDIIGNYTTGDITLPAASSSTVNVTETGLHTHSLSTETSIDIEWDLASGETVDIPFDLDDAVGKSDGENWLATSGHAYLRFYYAVLYINIASELTDQT